MSQIKSTLNRLKQSQCKDESYQEGDEIYRHTIVSRCRLWKVDHELKPLGSSNTSTSHSFPRISSKPSSTEVSSHSMALIQHRALPSYHGSTRHNKPQHSTWNPTSNCRPGLVSYLLSVGGGWQGGNLYTKCDSSHHCLKRIFLYLILIVFISVVS